MRLVITRPAEDAEKLAAALRAQGHEPHIHPLLEIVFPPLAPISLDGIAALIATSRNALKGLAANAAFDAALVLPIYCVGEATATLARQLGFTDIRTGAGTAKDLPALIAATAQPEAGALLYVTGEQLAFDLEAVLAAQGFPVRRVTVYEAREAASASTAPLATKLARAEIDGVILMSPRTAAIFVAILARTGPAPRTTPLACYCYSEAVASPLRHLPDLTLHVARRPTEADMLALTALASK